MLGLGNSITSASYTGGLGLSGFSMSFDASNADGLPQIGLTFTETTFDIDGSTLSFSFWAKVENADNLYHVFGDTGSDANSFFKRISIDGSSDKLVLESNANGNEMSATITSDTNWHHYVITTNGSGGYAMYQDGSALTTAAVNISSNIDIDSIGGGGNAFRFDGLLFQCAIWDAELDADAVSAIYNSGTPIPLQEDKGNYDNSGDLIHLWRFAEGSGSTSEDSVGSLDGTLQPAASFSTTTPYS